MKIKKKVVLELLDQLQLIEKKAIKFEKKYEPLLRQIHPANLKSAQNLLHYIALRSQDIKDLQTTLGQLGISRLGRAEGHVMASILSIKNLLHKILATKQADIQKSPVTVNKGKKILKTNTSQLFGKKLKGSRTRIMVTLPGDAAYDYKFLKELANSGMNCARINCAHDNEEVWKLMIEKINKAKAQTGRNIKISMDLCGPKLRTGTMRMGPKVMHIQPERDLLGRVTSPALVWLAPEGTLPEDEADLIIPVSGEWLKNLNKNSIITFTDSRKKKRKLMIDQKRKPGWSAKCYDSVYITTGTLLTAKSNNQTIAKTKVGELLPLEDNIILKPGDKLILHRDLKPGEPAEYDREGRLLKSAHISCTLPEIFSDVSVGEPILIDDGKIEGRILSVAPEQIEVEVSYAKNEGSKVKADKGINLPESKLSVSGLTPKDRRDLEFVAKHANVVNVSFINDVNDVYGILDELKRLNAEHLGIILKIETRKGFENLPSILLAAMRHHPIGVMVARGDLAIECGWKELAPKQEEILWLCEAAHVPLVWATQVLETMAKKGKPSRAEITDAAFAEQAECVMLNKGPHIFETIKILDEILTQMQVYHEKKAPMLPKLKMLAP